MSKEIFASPRVPVSSLEMFLGRLIVAEVGDERPKPKPEGTGPDKAPDGYRTGRRPTSSEPKKPAPFGK